MIEPKPIGTLSMHVSKRGPPPEGHIGKLDKLIHALLIEVTTGDTISHEVEDLAYVFTQLWWAFANHLHVQLTANLQETPQ